MEQSLVTETFHCSIMDLPMENQPLHMFLLYFHHILISLSLSQNIHVLCVCVVSPEGTVCRTRTCLVCVQWRRGPSFTQGVKDTLTANQLARRILCQRLRDGMPVVHTQQIKCVSVCVCARMCVQVYVSIFASFCYFFYIPLSLSLCCFVVGSSLSVRRIQPREIGRESVC